MHRLAQATLVLALVAIGSRPITAQQVPYSTFPTEDPRARRAAELLEPLLRGDAAAADAYLARHAAPGYGTGEEMIAASEVAAEFGGWAVVGWEQPPEDGDALTVYVRKGDQVRGVMIRIESGAPHRFIGIMRARIRLETGPARGWRPREGS